MTVVYSKGFTLIEIMLVLVIMTVLTAMVAPNFFAATQGDVKTEARFMQKILRLASEEAQLTGKPVRCSVYSNQLVFETPAPDGTWMTIQDTEFQQDMPRPPVEIMDAQLEGDIGLGNGLDNGSIQADKVPPLARLMFWGDGSLSAGKITLGIPDSSETLTIQLHAGAGGIRVLNHDS
ncbi:MAG: type II secretion system protein [Zetaproteobacteria bacterium]|nr:type II secretion system protein [Zetaproteobacteria bacterium]